MKPSQLKDLLRHTVPAGMPVLIVSGPGVGKSSIVEQIAAELETKLIISHPGVDDPTDVKGLPWPNAEKEEASFLPFGPLAQALRATTPTIWFLDDLGQAPAAVQASYMQLLLAREVNGHHLPDCVTFIAATNRRTDRAGVTGILEPVKSRFVTIIELEPDLDEWCSWAIANDLPEEEIAFLRFRSELLYKFAPTADLTNSPLPRTWENAAKLLAFDMADSVLLPALSGAVGEGAAGEFISFRDIVRSAAINIDGILMHPDNVSLPPPDKPAVLYAVVTALAARANEKTFGRIARYAGRLVDAQMGEFAVLLIRDTLERDESLADLPEWTELATTKLNELMGAVA